MRRNCNLELRLRPPSLSAFSPKNICTTPYFSMEDKESKELEQLAQQQLTIFYNGKHVVSDATEHQAKAIIYLASREIEEKTKKTPSPISKPSSPLLQPQTGLFMKRSLQRFLQKRKNRIQTTLPYHH
ncbi:protein TIFY 5A-like [Lycium barbarum]|uniref:protein TIFY 5A-like n=1 Tax=Lycium barbarum TaxID=112863 RepID=UPI00293E5B0A|nr:protein TIFY 5A-like [Lycium barbarum]